MARSDLVGGSEGPSVAVISLRPREPVPGLGRSVTLRGLLDGLPDIGCRPDWVQVTAPRSRLIGLASAIIRWVGQAGAGRPAPLQSIFALQGRLPPSTADRDVRSVAYVDGVRLAYLVPALRARYGRVIVDFDDLMSRRVGRMQRRGEQMSFGAFAGLLPSIILRLLHALAPVQRRLYGLEKRLVRAAEIRAAAQADALGFTSPYEASLFLRFLRRYRPQLRPRCLVLGPSLPPPRHSPAEIRARPAPEDIRYIFIGSDVLEQNRVAIQGILDLAAEGVLAAPAHIYGRMTHPYPETAGVRFEGFAPSLDDVYRPGSILLMPRSVRGGIKSKILEALTFGVPTIAASSAVEGFDQSYPWRVDGAALRSLVGDTSALRSGYQDAVASGIEICMRRFSEERYWAELQTYFHAGTVARTL